MNPAIDIANELVWIDLISSVSEATNNAVSPGVNISNFVGRPALNINIGRSTAGTTPTCTIYIQHSATNNASNAVNFTGVTGFSAVTNPSSNNAAVVSVQIPIDVRDCLTYLFARVVLGGTSSPAFPVHVQLVGSDKAQ